MKNPLKNLTNSPTISKVTGGIKKTKETDSLHSASPDKRLARLREGENPLTSSPSSTTSSKPRRGSVSSYKFPSQEVEESGRLRLKIGKLEHKVAKGTQNIEDLVLYVVVSVMRCQLLSSLVEYSECVTFDEAFFFNVCGTFDVKLDVFLQRKMKKQHYDAAEHLGTLEFPISMGREKIEITGEYQLIKEGVDTTTNIVLELAMKPQEADDIDRSSLPEADLVDDLSYQVRSKTGVSYSWLMQNCELRGRTLRFYEDGKMKKIIRMDARSKATKVDTSESEISLPYNSFEIMVGESPVFLVAQSGPQMKKWIDMLNKASVAEIF